MASAHRRLIGFGVATIIVAAATGFGPGAAKAKAATSPITFGTPTVMDPIHTFGEPNVGINPVDGSVYASGPQGTGVQRSGWEGSVDGGSTFRIVGQCPNQTSFVTATQPCSIPGGPNAASDQPGPNAAPGGGDAEQKFDSKGTQYFADLYALACQRVAYTTNDGATAPESPFGCGQTAPACGGVVNNITNPALCPGEGSDRQWLSVLDPGLINQQTVPHPASPPAGFTPYAGPYPIVYMEYNNLGVAQNNCSDWFMSGNPMNPTTMLTYQAANQTSTGNFGCDGYPSVDQETGQLLEASTCATTGSVNSICLNIATPDSTGFLHFRDDAGGPGLIPVATNLTWPGANLFVVSSIDSGQNLHVSYGLSPASATAKPTDSAAWQMYTTVASAASGWTNWATPVQVSQPGSINIFPWVAAGDGPECQTSAAARVACAGRSDTTWYGTFDNAEGPSSTTPGNQVWDVYMGQVVWPVDANGAYVGGAPLSNTPVKVTPHPMQFGSICLLGTGCITAQGNRNVADFFEVQVDSHGAAVVSYDDNANNLLQPGAPAAGQAADHAGAGVVTVARQTGGLGLAGVTVPAPCSTNCTWSSATPNYETSTPVSGMVDASGDAKYPVIGGANLPGLDFTGNQLALSNDSSTLTVTMKVSDLSNAAIQNAFNAAPGTTNLTYVTRWLMPSAAGAGTCSLPLSTACTMFYAMAELTPAATPGGTPTVAFYAGIPQTVDLCSVSACFPHVVYFGETPPGGNTLASGGTFDQATGTITVKVPAGDVGSPGQNSLLEEVGTYAFASSHPQSAVTTAQAQADNVPFEVDGICCFNFQANNLSVSTPEVPWTPALVGVGVLLIGAGLVRRRRHNDRTEGVQQP